MFPSVPILLLLAFISMLNGTGTDRSASQALDLAVIPGLVSDTKRTWSLALYNVFLDGGGSLGTGCRSCLSSSSIVSVLASRSYRIMFFGYWCLSAGGSHVPLLVTGGGDRQPGASKLAHPEFRWNRRNRCTPDRTFLARCLRADSDGRLVAYWFFRRFELPSTIALVFLLSTYSMPVPIWVRQLACHRV